MQSLRNLFPENDFGDRRKSSAREAEFLRELALASHELYAASLAVVGNRDDADDVIQEACVVLWRKYDDFEEGTNFRKWAHAVTFNVARTFVRSQRRRQGSGFNDYVMTKISQVRSASEELLEVQNEALRECLEKMPEADREFLSECYQRPNGQTALAKELGRPVDAIYTRLKRLRKRLSDCMTRTLGREWS